jgi:hypothetical protein
VPTAVPTQTPQPTPSPAPTLDPQAVAERIDEGRTELASREIDPLCLRWEDADDDGAGEWVGLYHRPGEPGRLEGFVWDAEAWHTLAAPAEDEEGLGTYPSCELEVRDLNADGRTELLVLGHAADDVDLLHLFVWRQTRYVMLASFRGDAGIDVVDGDGDLNPEIVARYAAGDGLAWEQVHTWDGSHYGWTWERYAWLYPDRPHAYPTHSPQRAVISFYLALGDRDLPYAYSLFSSSVEASQAYETWARGFDTTLAVEAGSVHEMERQDQTATVAAQVRSYDNLDGYVVGRLWDVTWSLVREGEDWQLQSVQAEELERWEAVYYR